MLIFDNTIESYIIKNLQKGSLSSVFLVKEIQKDLKVTKQAIYKSLRNLKRREIVVSAGKNISLNTVWINKISLFFEEAHLNYTGRSLGELYTDLEDGDSIVYRFHNFNTADSFWAHAALVLSKQVGIGERVYIYNPHEWFAIARPESELLVFDNLHKEQKNTVFYIAGNTDLDRRVGKLFSLSSQQYFASGVYLFPKENYYLNIYGEFLIEVWLDEAVSRKIDLFFKTHKEVSDYEKDILHDIIHEQGINKLKISRNKKKAEKLKKKLDRFFLFSGEK